MSEWRTIESAPKDGSYFVAYVAGSVPFVCLWQNYADASLPEGGYWAFAEDLISDVEGEANPSHWMPLPDPPKGDGE